MSRGAPGPGSVAAGGIIGRFPDAADVRHPRPAIGHGLIKSPSRPSDSHGSFPYRGRSPRGGPRVAMSLKGEEMRSRSAFTLVEVLIVVIILGILAAIVVPQFTNASSDAKMTSLKTNLQTIRGQIQLYKLQHNDTYPTAAGFVNQMTLASKADGSTAAVGTAGFDLGPYLQTIPANPYTNANAVGAGAVGTSDWFYDEATGTFRANDANAHTGY